MKSAVKVMLWTLCLLLAVNISVREARAVDDNDGPAEEVLFSESVSPDVLLLIDLSGSMNWSASGGTPDSTNPSRLTIAKQAIFSLLDYNGDGVINSADSTGLNVRFGYMRFYGCSSSSEEQYGTFRYSYGCNTLINGLGSGTQLGTPYSYIYCKSNTGCTVTDNCKSGCVNRETASGGTPLSAALHEAKLYLDYHKEKDTAARECRKKYVLLISDGADTYACGGDGAECQTDSYKRRREAVLRAKALKDAGYRVFVIGLGSDMPSYLKNTLNWMAYYGGTDNADDPNVIATDSSGNPILLDVSKLTSCKKETSFVSTTEKCISEGHTYNWNVPNNDPGYKNISGYAFMAGTTEDLSKALKDAVSQIVSAIYSFSQASIQASRTEDENFLYEGSFEPTDNDSFWKGHLKKYPILYDGTVGQKTWDAGEKLAKTSAGSRNIYTYKGGENGALTEFTTSRITPADLGITAGTDDEKNERRNEIIGFIRGESAYNTEIANIEGTGYIYKLGDVFRTTPITVGTPSVFYADNRDTGNAFATHRANHVRTSENQKRVVTVGSNNGQFHAFHTYSGNEAWSFVPPNLMSKLYLIAHKAHPTALTHHYFIDGPLSGADVWMGSGDGKEKNAADWKTILVFGEGRGAVNYGWSSSPSCDAGINPTYDESGTVKYKYYCGYHALNVTDSPSTPTYLWNVNFTNEARAAQAPYFGDPWSKMQLGRIRINVDGVDTEKWVGFVGGGYNATDLKNGSDKRGKGFFVVDLSTGQVLWSFTNGSTNTSTSHTDMDYSLPAGPAIIDTDNDGFIDAAYIGDLGGNVWRFKFCRNADMSSSSSCGISNWSANLFYDSSTGAIRPIFTIPSAAKDKKGNLWIYWGTGDKINPTEPSAQEHFYGVKDLDRNATYTLSDIVNLSSDTQTYSDALGKVGYRIQLNGQGEKVLADPVVFGGVVYFTTYRPPDASNLCLQAGSAYLYGIKYTTGAGALESGRNMFLGAGISSSPIISVGPDGKRLYVTVSGGAGISGQTIKVSHTPAGRANMTNMIYWKDKRIETN